MRTSSIQTKTKPILFNIHSDLEKYRIDSFYEKEPETIVWIENCMSSHEFESPIFFDIGANIGIFSLYAASVNEKSRVFSFEPSPKNFSSLIDNITINNYHNVYPSYFAVSSKSEFTNLFIPDDRPGNSGAQINYPVDENGLEFNPKAIIPMLKVSIDTILNSLNIPSPNYVKIDVDGHEDDIIDGLLPFIKATSFRSLLVEVNGEDKLRNLEQLFKRHDLIRDQEYETFKNHSSIRRAKNGSSARNIVFSKFENLLSGN